MRKIITVSIRLNSDFSGEQNALISSLPFGESEKSRLNSIKNPSHKAESLAALVALNDMAQDSSEDLTVSRTDNSKPYFKSSALQFSLSHSGRLSVAALCERPVGIDVELLDKSRNNEKLIGRFFSEEEKEILYSSADSSLSFYSIWTKKEALTKISGDGLSGIKEKNSISCFSHQYLLRLQTETYVMSVCTSAPDSITINNAYKELTVYEL